MTKWAREQGTAQACGQPPRVPRFDARRLPETLIYYARELKGWKVRGDQLCGLCPFHDDHHPSFCASLKTGAFICFTCNARGRDIIDFHRRKYAVGFVDAVRALGAWR